MDVLILRLDAPMLAFGGPVVDNRNFTNRFPGRSAITGLLGNALGYDHRDAGALSSLQKRIRYGAR
ncbi:MAG: CRISPR-associated protein Cas5, partial [Polyangiaceae bacterium]|nr:CRISPR-associated protein Cas5 [Polyangiaceae bacterium]